MLNNDNVSGVVESVVNSKKHLANCAKEEITKLKTEPLDATSAAINSATQQPSFHVRHFLIINNSVSQVVKFQQRGSKLAYI